MSYNESQIRSAVKGEDRFRPRRKPFPWIALFLFAACAYGLFELITKGMK